MDDGGISVTGLTIGGAALTTLGGLAGAYLKARYSRARIEPQPLEVKPAPAYVTCAACLEHRKAIHARIDAVTPQLRSITDKLDIIDAKAEERSRNLHKRLDPLVATVAGSKERIDNHLADHRAGQYNNSGK